MEEGTAGGHHSHLQWSMPLSTRNTRTQAFYVGQMWARVEPWALCLAVLQLRAASCTLRLMSLQTRTLLHSPVTDEYRQNYVIS